MAKPEREDEKDDLLIESFINPRKSAFIRGQNQIHRASFFRGVLSVPTSVHEWPPLSLGYQWLKQLP
ncbi:MAG TPA: hypothetical protein DCO77_07190 [Nitrospiraceae bacterium]|nr:hypothetical protein [Nitrospiraceae bacterium]